MAVAENPTTWFQDIVQSLGKFEPILPACVEEELSKMASGRGKRAHLARVSLDLASKFGTIPCGNVDVDDEIMSVAMTIGAVVATMDASLAFSLKAAHLRVVSLRSGRAVLG
jgi:rRNA-processing protein FCF1